MGNETSRRRAHARSVALVRRVARTAAPLLMLDTKQIGWSVLGSQADRFTRALLEHWLVRGVGAPLPDVARASANLIDAWSRLMKERVAGPSTEAANAGARAMAVTLHAMLSNAYASGRAARGEALGIARIDEELTRMEHAYRESLRSLHLATRQGDAHTVATVLDSVRALSLGTFRDTVERAAALSSAHQLSRIAPGLRASRLARRYAMLAASCVHVHARLASKTMKRTTPEVAARRARLTRDDVQPARALMHLSDLQVNRAVTVLGSVRSLEFVERPSKPYGSARLAPKGGRLILPFKSFTRQGVTPGAIVCATGKVKQHGELGLLMEVEQEGPQQHASDVWEDWLASEVRHLYDLYPASLRMEWELPPAGARGSRMDLISRVTQRTQRAS